MATPSRPAGPAARTTAVEHPAGSRGLGQARRRGARGLWLVVGIALALLKANGLAAVLDHRAAAIVLLGLALVYSVFRPRPVWIALSAGPLLAFALAPPSTAAGIELGIGTSALLLSLFFAIATVLQARQEHDTPD
jgi:hypothetical protein